MLHGERDEAEGAVAAEHAAIVFEALERDRLVERSALGASDESDDGLRDERDDFVAFVGPFGLGREVEGFGRHAARDSERRAYDSRARRGLQSRATRSSRRRTTRGTARTCARAPRERRSATGIRAPSARPRSTRPAGRLRRRSPSARREPCSRRSATPRGTARACGSTRSTGNGMPRCSATICCTAAGSISTGATLPARFSAAASACSASTARSRLSSASGGCTSR